MSSRSSFRRKMVLAVTVIRHGGEEKQLAHTLDVTSTSARLGGLVSLLEPGEIIEVQRGAVKAKFQVAWMGAPGGAMAGQAGIRGLDPNRSIWSIDLPEDEIDITVDAANLRQPMPAVHTLTQFPGEKRWHPRYTCAGSVAVKTPGTTFAVHGEAKDISKGGVYIELNAPLPVNSSVSLDLCVEEIRFEATGMVRTSYPLLGMGVCFHNLTPGNAEKLALVLERAKRKAAREQTLTSLPTGISQGSATASVDSKSFSDLNPDENPAQILVEACRKLAEDFERWKLSCSPGEIEELKQAVRALERKLASPSAGGFIEFLAPPVEGTKPV